MPSPPQPASRRPPRARQRLGAHERRDQILREAMRCFASHGFRGTTTRLLAQRVGITEAALYRYFPSKQSLYAAIVDRKMAAPDVVDSARRAADARDDLGVFSTLAREILTRGHADPDFLRILLFTALEGHALSEPFFASRVRRLREFLTAYVTTRIDEGAFRPVDPVLAARAFLGMVFDHLNVQIVFGQGSVYTQPLERVVDTFVGIFLSGLREREGDRRAEPR